MTTLLYLMACLMSPAPLSHLAESRVKDYFVYLRMPFLGDVYRINNIFYVL